MSPLVSRRRALMLSALLPLGPSLAQAQDRPLRLLLGMPPGSTPIC